MQLKTHIKIIFNEIQAIIIETYCTNGKTHYVSVNHNHNDELTFLEGGWYRNKPRLLFCKYPILLSSDTLLMSSMDAPRSSFFNKHEYAKLSRADSPHSRCFFDCAEFSFDFASVEKFVSQLLLYLNEGVRN